MKYIAILLVGVIIGAAAVFYLLAVRPGSTKVTGSPVKTAEQGGDPPGTVVVAIDEAFFDQLLGAMFRDLGPPSFRLSKNQKGRGEFPGLTPAAFEGGCTNEVVLAREGSDNVKTGVRFTEGKITSPLAFSGSYNAPVAGCLEFKGTAAANVQLNFDQTKHTVYGQVNVERVSLDGVNPLAGSLAQVFVQNAINERVNPVEVIPAQQLALSVPVQASKGTLKARVKDVRSEIKDGVLRLHISYDFGGVK
jgi:hypothetical protein